VSLSIMCREGDKLEDEGTKQRVVYKNERVLCIGKLANWLCFASGRTLNFTRGIERRVETAR
jgi:hypothetical protein